MRSTIKPPVFPQRTTTCEPPASPNLPDRIIELATSSFPLVKAMPVPRASAMEALTKLLEEHELQRLAEVQVKVVHVPK